MEQTYKTAVVIALQEARVDALVSLSIALRKANDTAHIVINNNDIEPTLIVSAKVAVADTNTIAATANEACIAAEEHALQRLAESALQVADIFSAIIEAAEEKSLTELSEKALLAAEAFTYVSESAEDAAVVVADVAEIEIAKGEHLKV